MSWKSWIPRIAGYGLAPFTGGASIAIGEGIAQGIGNSEAINTANQQQQAATQQAQRIGGDVYTQQRADAQNLFGQPYQTLGGLLGMNIAPIGAPGGQVQTTANPAGFPRGLVENSPPQIRPGIKPGSINTGLTPLPVQTAATLNDLRKLASKSKSTSGYAKARA